MSQGDKIALRLDAAVPGLEALDGVISLSAGVFEGARNEESDRFVAEYAIYNEFGTRRIPARPALRTTLEANEDHYLDGLAETLMSGLAGEGPLDLEAALETLGQTIEGDITKNIAEWESPPNAKATRDRKAKKNAGNVPGPLKDTTAYLRAVSSRVDR